MPGPLTRLPAAARSSGRGQSFNPSADQAARVWLQDAEGTRERRSEACNQYTAMGDAFAHAVLNDTAVPTPLEDAVANMRVIDAIVRSAKTGGWVEIG